MNYELPKFKSKAQKIEHKIQKKHFKNALKRAKETDKKKDAQIY